MKAISVFFVYFYALIWSGTSSVDVTFLDPTIKLVEMDYVDECSKLSTATWEELIGTEKGLSNKIEQDFHLGLFAKTSRTDIQSAYNQSSLGPHDELLRRKVQLLIQPGDLLLESSQLLKLVTFANKAQNKLRFATNYDCGNGYTCSLREFQNSFARQQDEKKLELMKKSWEDNLPDMTEYAANILPLLRNASKDYVSVEEYWDYLVEYEGALLKARELWENIRPLYTKLHNYIALRLKGDDAVGQTLPTYLLKSLIGDDWSNAIESLLPKHAAIYKQVNENLQLKNLGGVHAFKAAAELIKKLNLGEIKPEIWSESVFNSTCPSTLIDWCKPNQLKVITCKDVSISNYLDAHETAMKIIYKQTMASYSNNTYLFREAPRYSAIYEAIPGFLSLLALSPHAIFRNNLFSAEVYNYNVNHHRTVLQLILALKDLPKLNFYLAADEWRLKLLMGKIPPSEAAASWVKFRKEFSLLDTSGTELLADPYVLSNQPFIGKFMGLILKYQIYQTFAEELPSDEHDILEQVASNKDRLSDIMLQGYSVKWPELVSDLLAQRESGLEYVGLTDYYRLLDEYLDSHFDPSFKIEDRIDDYLDPAEADKEFDDTVDEEENTIEDDDAEFDLGNDPVVVEMPIPDTDTNSIHGETTTFQPALSEVKPEPPKEASYNIYWWIGIAVALAVVVILIAIIARKRHNHRKELERQRKESSRA